MSLDFYRIIFDYHAVINTFIQLQCHRKQGRGGGRLWEMCNPTLLENVICSLRVFAAWKIFFSSTPHPPRYNFLPTVVSSKRLLVIHIQHILRILYPLSLTYLSFTKGASQAYTPSNTLILKRALTEPATAELYLRKSSTQILKS